MPRPEIFACRLCGGTGEDPEPTPIEREDCETCDGECEVDCECLSCGDDHARECDDCDSTGDAPRVFPPEPCRCCGTAGNHLGGICEADQRGAVETPAPLFPWLGDGA